MNFVGTAVRFLCAGLILGVQIVIAQEEGSSRVTLTALLVLACVIVMLKGLWDLVPLLKQDWSLRGFGIVAMLGVSTAVFLLALGGLCGLALGVVQ
jgi:hypothetical protein